MTAFLLSASRDGSIHARALGALRRARPVLTTPGAEDWVSEWLPPAAARPVVFDGLDALREHVARQSGSPAGLAVVVEHPDELDGVRRALSSIAGVREIDTPPAPALYPDAVVARDSAERWARDRPLLGWSVMVTRPAHQAGDLADLLSERGAEPLVFPAIRILPPADPARLDRSASSVDDYHWIVLTSANGVRALADALFRVGRDARALAGRRVAAIGPGTASALRAFGIQPDIVPRQFVAESLLEALEPLDGWDRRRVLLPRAAEARDVIPEGLGRWGADVDVVPAYRTEPEGADSSEARQLLDEGRVDLVTFTASSAVRAFREGIGGLGQARAVAIGPITAGTAREHAIALAGVADEYTMEGLVRACERVVAGDG